VLDTVKQRAVLNCSTDNSTPGFGYLNTKTGEMEGLERGEADVFFPA
jgi:general L-amino acid transport system substrate-binding protein